MHRKKNNVIYVDFLFKRKKIKSKFMILLYSFYTSILKSSLKFSIKKFSEKSITPIKQENSNY